ncbi:polyisoprenoid-binding protein YceI [Stackebrandtia albiflava]|uniref:Polyisoprenoid-binding protein YceI n=1 Tax=Stackebrandtia albiflava TaxID=406432 RepID=A0A562VC78_9ACTN|nr:YceI family protein [Stackebrandtia albiflava]TWJ15493.1 polyisoprenoid-binding protein YceI [Stackebrandtia albiflava]
MTSTILDPALTGVYTLDPSHSRLGFTARHAMVTKVRGGFTEFEGTGRLDFDNPANSTAEVTIQVASVDTRNEQRDAHLRNNDFFDAPTYPTITFKSTGVEQIDETDYKMTGDLTIKGVTKPITIAFEYIGASQDPYGNQRVGFEGKASLNRSDFGVNFNAALETGGVLVSEKITLEFDVSAIKSA